MTPDRFNLRVYGVLQNPQGEYLLCQERYGSRELTKFPGGGIDLGEGIHNALIREFKEETGLDVLPEELLYFNTDFLPSAFDDSQVICFYYRVRSTNGFDAQVGTVDTENLMGLKWMTLNELQANANLTMPLDQLVVREKLSE